MEMPQEMAQQILALAAISLIFALMAARIARKGFRALDFLITLVSTPVVLIATAVLYEIAKIALFG